MKKFISFAIIGILILASCEKSQFPPEESRGTPETFSVTLETDTVEICAAEKTYIEYEIRNHETEVVVKCSGAEGVTVWNLFEYITGKGRLTFATENTEPSEITALFTFYDGEDYIDKEITIITAPSWNIRPGTPVKGDPTWNQE